MFYEYRQLPTEEQKALVSELLQRGFPPHRPPHIEQGPGYYLLTAAIYEHRPLIEPSERRSSFQNALLNAFDKPEQTVVAWVILPTHYHTLVWLPSLKSVTSIFKLLHGRTSREWNIQDMCVGRKVWYRYSDRAIRNEAHFYRTINYLHANPVRHGYVQRSGNWAWSSLARYLDTVGRYWMVQVWNTYPIGNYGDGWDEAA